MPQLLSRLKCLFALLAGLAVVACATRGTAQLQQWLLICVGMAGILGGAWYLYAPSRLTPRRQRALRNEVDVFIDLVRQLHALFQTAREGRIYPWHDDTLQTLKTKMHEAVERIAWVAEAGEEIASSTPEVLAPAESESKPEATGLSK